ncbi:MAG: transporter substrate-binding domain-containing protein [Leptospiraceae bacterium]|nr:transporter substrate-binding domain-containing protein [Leptospiraceae bacterium]
MQIPSLHAKERLQTIKIGTRLTAPFFFKNEQGEYTGISYDFLKLISRKLNIEFTIHEFTLNGLLEAVEKREVDLGVAALTMSSEREMHIDFSHPFYNTGLAIAIKRGSSNTFITLLKQFGSWGFMKAVLFLLSLLTLAGLVIWFAERRKNKSEFPEKPREGILQGIWWAAVTVTTVGYGDKSPKTFAGRFFALFWMFSGLIFISSFTASITASLTISELSVDIRNIADLRNYRVGTIENSAAQNYLKDNQIKFKGYRQVQEGLNDLLLSKIDAFIYDEPILQYALNTSDYKHETHLLPRTFYPQFYGIAMPQGHPLRENLNREILTILASKEWQAVLNEYLGNR